MGGIEKTPHSENDQTEGSDKPRRQPSLNRAFDVRSLDGSTPNLFCFHADSEDSLYPSRDRCSGCCVSMLDAYAMLLDLIHCGLYLYFYMSCISTDT